jgi:hypothetical protein
MGILVSKHRPHASTAVDAPAHEPDGPPVFAPYDAPAGGWGALRATAHALCEQSIALKGSKTLLSMNQPDGFDCPGCAWPDPKHTSSFEFCENGARSAPTIQKHNIDGIHLRLDQRLAA